MITRRNWLLRCSILANVAVLLYICSHLMIGGGNFAMAPAYLYSDDDTKLQMRQDRMRLNIQEASLNSIEKIEKPIEGVIDPVDRQQSQSAAGEQKKSVVQSDAARVDAISFNSNSNNLGAIDENRFDVPTDQSINIKNDIVYQEGGSGPNTNLSLDSYSPATAMDLEARLKLLLHCHDKDYEPSTIQRGDFWVLKNYVRADHGELRCFETITYTTHADYTFLDNLIPLLERWNSPISIALHAPGTDFAPTINSIKYLRDCTPESNLVRQFVTFHIYFSSKHVPKSVPKYSTALLPPYNCSIPPPFSNISTPQLYKTQKKLLYPVNVGRNVARDAAMTHFILASDIELYPNPGLVQKFLEMIARNDVPLQRSNPKVFPLSIFEVDSSVAVPRDKTELQELLRVGKAIPFHKRVCSSCHGVPKSKEWMAANETEDLGIFHIGKRIGYYVHWEPIYIGTHADPHYDERLSWEGKSDKMTQGFALCVLDYEFQILNNAFLVHKPGIKILKKDPKRAMLAAKTNSLIKKIIYPELQVMYGTRKGCAV